MSKTGGFVACPKTMACVGHLKRMTLPASQLNMKQPKGFATYIKINLTFDFFKFLACLQRRYYMLLYAFTFNTIDAIGSEEGVKGLVSQVTKLC